MSGHRAGPYESLSALCHAALHYLLLGSQYLLWVGLGGHYGHCAGIICHSRACVAIAQAVRALCGHCAGMFESLSAVRHAALHYLLCGSHYLPWAGLGDHCDHGAGIICHSWTHVVISRAVSCGVIAGPVRLIICRAPCCTALSAVRQPLSVVVWPWWSLWLLRGHYLPFSGMFGRFVGS